MAAETALAYPKRLPALAHPQTDMKVENGGAKVVHGSGGMSLLRPA